MKSARSPYLSFMLDYEPPDQEATPAGDSSFSPQPAPASNFLPAVPEGPMEYGAPAPSSAGAFDSPSGAPWNFLDLFFTLMSVLGSLFLAEAIGMIALAVYEAASGGGSFQMSAAIKGTATDARFQIPVQFVSYALVVA